MTFESNGTGSTYYTYDAAGDLISLNLNGTEYYYIRNAQGDITGLFNSAGTQVVAYTYDSWGKLVSTTGSLAATLGVKNPYRYRGYRYDTETGLYYLNSRYYNPETSRYLNADDIAVLPESQGQLQIANLFIYSRNNPVNNSDPSGYWSIPNSWKIGITVGILAVAAGILIASGAGAPIGCVLLGVAQGAIAGAATGALAGVATGAAVGAVSSRISTGSWKGAGSAALKGANQGLIDGAFSGAITGAITGGITSKVCFVEGTAILTATGYVAIENIRIGDMVWSENPETGEKALKRVVQTFVNETIELVHVFVNGEEIVTTPEHPFWVPKKGWINSISLRAGDILVLQNGKYVTVEQVQHEILERPATVYNFKVEDFHTYYVTNSSILVHNANCGPLKGKNAVNAANKLGYKATNYFSKGQKVFYNAKTKMYITADVDSHIGGVWKMANTVKGLASKSSRLGTFDEFLNWIGK